LEKEEGRMEKEKLLEPEAKPPYLRALRDNGFERC